MHVYERVVRSIKSLENRIDYRQVIIPIGLDGAVAYHLLHYHWIRRGVEPDDHLSNILQATSRFDEFDGPKFSKLLQDAHSANKSVYGLDIRTKTGKLGSMLRSHVKPTVKFFYVVLFDPELHADIRGTTEELTDEDREHLYWIPSFEAEREFIRKESGIWIYNISHDTISKLNHVQHIKDLLIR